MRSLGLTVLTSSLLLALLPACTGEVLPSGDTDSKSEPGGTGADPAVGASGGAGSGGAAGSGGSAPAGTGGAGSGGGSPQGTGGSSPQEGVGLFVAQGHVGRTTVSCDGGVSWVADQSAIADLNGTPAADVRCFSDGVDCDHNGYPGRGVVFGGGRVFTTFGWGEPGQIRRSADGASWEGVTEGTVFGGLAYVQNTVIAGGWAALRSTDGGSTWSEPIETGLDGYNVRRVGQTASHGGRVILVGETGDAVVSSDAGLTWWNPDSYPEVCGAYGEGGIAANETVWVIVGGEGTACRSTDGGKNWTAGNVGGAVSSHLVYSEGNFLVWGHDGARYSSPDGATWTSTPTDLKFVLGAVAADATGRIVGVRGGWQTWYEDQVFVYSDDGLVWTEAGRFAGSHPILEMAFGYGMRPDACD